MLHWSSCLSFNVCEIHIWYLILIFFLLFNKNHFWKKKENYSRCMYDKVISAMETHCEKKSEKAPTCSLGMVWATFIFSPFLPFKKILASWQLVLLNRKPKRFKMWMHKTNRVGAFWNKQHAWNQTCTMHNDVNFRVLTTPSLVDWVQMNGERHVRLSFRNWPLVRQQSDYDLEPLLNDLKYERRFFWVSEWTEVHVFLRKSKQI